MRTRIAFFTLVTLYLTTSHAVSFAQNAKQRPVLPGDACWTGGFWGDRFQLCSESIIPDMEQALEDPANGAYLGNFRRAVGLEEGGHRATNWSDGDCYKWLEAQAWLYAVTRDPKVDVKMDYWIDLIARTQAKDGYIGTQTQLNPNKERWGARVYHELYNHGHLMTAAAVHYQATGKDSFLAVAEKLAAYLETVFGPRPKELADYGWNPSNIMGLVDLYRVTGNKRWLDLAGVFVDIRGTKSGPSSRWGLPENTDDPHPGDQNQNRVPVRNETKAVGHAVTGIYLWAGAADVYAETGDRSLLKALRAIWTDMVERKMYVTGAVGAYHHGVSDRYDLVHEAFGREYELPLRDAYNETCANISNAMWNRRMMQITGEAQFGDVMERVLYNAGISGMQLDGRAFCYCNPLRRQHGTPLLDHDSPKRLKTMTCYCCPPSVARLIAKSAWWAYGVSQDAVWINLYGEGTLDTQLPGGEAVELHQESDFPWDGTVTITIDAAPTSPIDLRLRIPAWADGAAIAVNGANASKVDAGQYASIKRTWKAGDTVCLTLPMQPRLVAANPLVESVWGQAAVLRGPVVYCAESMDLPEGVALSNVRLPRDAAWQIERRFDLLGGVTLLRTQARSVTPPRGDGLYRPLTSGQGRKFPLTLIPYYAWNNREETEMSVWLCVD
jgi:DUF1680 family protein